MTGRRCRCREGLGPSTFAAPTGPTQPITINGVNLPGGVGKERPTREEVMASYHQLLDSGFFGAHAIKSTRHPGAGASEALLSTSLPSQRPGGPPTEFSPHPFETSAPDHLLACSYAHGTPDSPHKTPQKSPSRRPLTATTPERPTTAPTPESRGKKRAHDEREDEEAATPRPTRKLRKTTRSIADFALPRIKRYRATESAQSPSSRTYASPSRRRWGTLARGVRTNKLAKRPASSSGGGSRPGSSRVPTRELTISGPVSSVVKLEPGKFDALQSGQATDIESLGGKVIATGVPWGRLAQQQQEELERMQQQQQQQQQQAGGQGVSPIQQQQGRRRNGPLSVRPDANREFPRYRPSQHSLRARCNGTRSRELAARTKMSR
ncbi:unnamed protein product [Parascedosporium putredinis]|uniref:Uncharacterized protein n=1 Tax=Parascedosporium putredinis TaxID=1442378 RepID=A0A9P1H5P9_9PEZI|nr:unnamed protein product [Parascedosporium putredinis]CAI7999523.1 unnamed protein product [Parascedosporium putredinis]